MTFHTGCGRMAKMKSLTRSTGWNPYTRTLDELKNDIIRIGSTAARLKGLE